MTSLLTGILLFLALPPAWISAISGVVAPLFLRWLGPAGLHAVVQADFRPYPTMSVLFLLALGTLLGLTFEFSIEIFGSLCRPLLHQFSWYHKLQLSHLSDTGRRLARAGYAPEELQLAIVKDIWFAGPSHGELAASQDWD